MSQVQRIETSKTVLKAAESVWAANKYFVLACSQQRYLQIRAHFRPDQQDLSAAYALLKQTEKDWQSVHSSDLPELSNALYHVMGYFKKLLSGEEKQQLNRLIKENPQEALHSLEKQTLFHHVDYLLPCRLWKENRGAPFNGIPVSLTVDGQIYPAYSWLWCEDDLIHKT